jgi:hypothetical protein
MSGLCMVPSGSKLGSSYHWGAERGTKRFVEEMAKEKRRILTTDFTDFTD